MGPFQYHEPYGHPRSLLLRRCYVLILGSSFHYQYGQPEKNVHQRILNYSIKNQELWESGKIPHKWNRIHSSAFQVADTVNIYNVSGPCSMLVRFGVVTSSEGKNRFSFRLCVHFGKPQKYTVWCVSHGKTARKRPRVDK